MKLCGFTRAADVEAAVDAGADAIGLNLIPSSKRYVSLDVARQLRTIGKGRAQIVAVVADMTEGELRELQGLGFDRAQLSGSEAPELVTALAPWAYKGVRIGNAADVAQARKFGGQPLLVDAKVGTALGGTGRRFDWSLVAELARERPLLVAGGLNEGNVAEAISMLRPYGVDVASGVESGAPGIKDPSRMRQFVAAARRAAP